MRKARVLLFDRRAAHPAARVNNGVTGDPRLSTPEIGKRYFDMKTKNAVAQIQALIAAASK